ncbi:MAG: 3-deoxy-manno-octulosonate cytidylyltransferase [Eubacteriales bacterium]|nr:3-deoxy-manno-octulosonate cytidylyltransferase [Eubacteriales bacterium]
MKIVGVIPARYQSSRFPGKPLALICGKPMIWWVYRQASQVKAFDEVLAATDSEEIRKACEEYGIPVRMTSDAHPTGTDRLGEIAAGSDADFFVNIQGDEPMIEPSVIQRIVDYKLANPETEVINTMTALKADQNVEEVSIVKAAAAENGDLLYLSRSPIPRSKRGLPVAYKRHLGLYGLSREALLFYSRTERGYLEQIEDVEMLRFMENGYRIKILEMESDSLGVDNPEDIEKVEDAMRKLEAEGRWRM